MDDDRVTLYGIVLGVLYVVAVGVQVWVVVDEVTHGALTDSVKARARAATARWTEARRIDAEARAGAPWVLWEAHQALDGEAS